MSRFNFAKRHVNFFSNEISVNISQAKPRLIKQIRASSGLLKLIGILLFAIYPIFISITQSAPNLTISETFASIFERPWVWIGVLVFIFLAIIHSLSMIDAPSVAILVSQIEDEIRRIQSESDEQYQALVFSVAVNGLARMILNLQKAVSGGGLISAGEIFRYNCEMLFSYLVTQENGEVVFNFNPGENWNLGVYIFNENTNELDCCFRDTAPSFLGRRFGSERSWAPGEGHIGVAFALKASQVTGDITKAENRDTFLIETDSPKFKQEDTKKYRSFVSAPIVKLDDQGKQFCVGVIYGTSDRPHRFGENEALPLQMIADYFASALPIGEALQALRREAVSARKPSKPSRRTISARRQTQGPQNGGTAADG